MASKVYGASDDLICFHGEISGEVGCYGTDDEDSKGVMLFFSDGTILIAKYGKGGKGIWGLTIMKSGKMLLGVDACFEETDAGYSDVANFADGKLTCYAATEWQNVR